MLKWLKGNKSSADNSEQSDTSSVPIGLPCSSSPLADTLISVVEREYRTSPSVSGIKHKRGQYSVYSPESKAKIARYALENGNSKAAIHFSSKFGK